ncbi:hypothetical protein PIB30_112438 [Stylosanthes scabra]|uniref:Uncharacterized protein n=1 Tax=Stylosanthes scabra TaxID=79078 RepID=A0ABU6S0U8_9FABA|nr:hypothetical protein [Stylosanthes scabra]
MLYVPNSSPVVHTAAVQPETGLCTFASLPSVPVKIVGQLAHNRAQPMRYGAHYTPVLSEPAYLQPSSPAVSMKGSYVPS